jgi:hypothetical protein
VNGLRLSDGFLYGNVKFKLPESCGNLTSEIYLEDSNLDLYAVVPKGKGSVKNQEVQSDYELYGFNLILKSDSSFEYETDTQAAETAE